jgi:hypothetical protein
MMDEYKDRFYPKKYEEEEPVAVGYGVPGDEEWGRDIEQETALVPSPIFARAQAIARGYDLHLMPLIDIYVRTELNKVQAETLLNELRFIKQVANDPLLAGWLEKMEKNVLRVVRSAKEMVVIIEGP